MARPHRAGGASGSPEDRKRGSSVSRVLSRATISLQPRSPAASSGRPAGCRACGPAGEQPPAAWPCSERGFPCPGRCRPGGGLLPRLFTLTPATARKADAQAVCFLWHCLCRQPRACARRRRPRVLPGVLLSGARTFLSATSVRTAQSGGLNYPCTFSAICRECASRGPPLRQHRALRGGARVVAGCGHPPAICRECASRGSRRPLLLPLPLPLLPLLLPLPPRPPPP